VDEHVRDLEERVEPPALGYRRGQSREGTGDRGHHEEEDARDDEEHG